ncbi:MAG: hypothetical protein Q8R28_00105 [Dehalococcoidia bacterium]|nr:hypothetical protein [Dehalococcoidia bacterium]
MKIVVVRFPDTANVSALATGAAVSVKVGTTEITGGTVNSLSSIEDPAPALVPHTHAEAPGTTGPATPT